MERDDRLIGDVVLWPVDDTLSRGEIGWAFHPDVAGQGYATEAVSAVLDIAFDEYGMHRVAAQLDPRTPLGKRMASGQ